MSKIKNPIPWSKTYNEYRFNFIKKIIKDPKNLSIFKLNKKLPINYGIGIDERCIEIPWVFAQLTAGQERVLDAGSALNHEIFVKQTIWQEKSLHILTLAPENNCFWRSGISYLYEDLRDIPIKDNYYDTVISVSTLEHIGFDNTLFTHKKTLGANLPEDFLYAVSEIKRVLKSKGCFLLTLPFGAYLDLGIAQQFDVQLLDKLINAFEPQHIEKVYYKYSINGWQLALEEECSNCMFLEWLADVYRSSDKCFPDPIPAAYDLAAAARAVVCLKMIKK